MIGGYLPTLRVDLNRLAADRITASTHFALDDFLPTLEVGDVIRVVEAEGDCYLALVEGVGGGADGSLVYLKLDLETPLPRIQEDDGFSHGLIGPAFEERLEPVPLESVS